MPVDKLLTWRDHISGGNSLVYQKQVVYMRCWF